jgi:hypothetical protein
MRIGQNKNSMAKKHINETETPETETPETETPETETPTTRKPRTPRTLTEMEIEAKRYYNDVRATAKLLPLVAKLSTKGRATLVNEINKINEQAEAGAFIESSQS